MEFDVIADNVRDAELLWTLKSNLVLSVDKSLSGAENMRRDEYNAAQLREQAGPQVYVRLYSWNPWCVSLGASQDERDIDLDAAREMGMDCVRRSTGGRAVLHADELTYSIVMCLPDNTSSHDVYRVSHEIIGTALRALGAHEVTFQRMQPQFALRYRTEGDSVSCFTSAARSEIMWRERKVVGSAQRRWSNVLLQHGSILLGDRHLCLADVVRVSDDEKRRQLRDSIQAHSVSMQQMCGRAVSFDEAAAAISEVLYASKQKSLSEAQA